MKFFKQEPKKSVLFVCVQNAGRSQMAEGFFKKYAPKEYEGISAGTMPVSEINPLAVMVMREVGIDISRQKSKEITEDMIRNSSKIVNMAVIWIRINMNSKRIIIPLIYAAIMVTAFVVMPSNPDKIEISMDLIQTFRILSAITIGVFWGILGITFGSLWDKFLSKEQTMESKLY